MSSIITIIMKTVLFAILNYQFSIQTQKPY